MEEGEVGAVVLLVPVLVLESADAEVADATAAV
jgi:hypothetical protein